jgi:hypothetical protein
MQLGTTSEVTMFGTRFSTTQALTALILVTAVVVSGLVVAARTGEEPDQAASGSAVTATSSRDRDPSSAPGDASTDAADVDEPVDATDPADAVAESSADGDATDPVEPAPAPAIPAVAPLAPPAAPDGGPLAILNLDPADAGITGYQGFGVPVPADHGGPSSYSVGTGCASPCIDSGVAQPLGTGARVEVVTDTPARIWIIVWNESLGHNFVSDSGAGSAVTSFSADFTELAGGTTYQAMAVAEDLNGYADHVYGELETLRRHVRFGLSNVVVTNQPPDTASFGTAKWADGQLYPGGWETPFPTIEDVDETVELVLLLEAIRECEKLCQAHPGWADVPSTTAGGWTDVEWIVLSQWDLPDQNRIPIDLEDTPALVETPTSRTFVLTLTNGPAGGALPGDYGPFGAMVDVTVWVTYS